MNRTKQRTALRLLVFNLLFIAGVLVWGQHMRGQSVAVAVAKGKQMLEMPANVLGLSPDYFIDTAAAEQLALRDDLFRSLLPADDYAFVSAMPMSAGESRYWQQDGCDTRNCVHVVFYDYESGGTVEAVANLDTQSIVGRWTDANARPSGSVAVLEDAFAIAAADSQVQSILGDIGAADPAMIPMSGWLADDACRDAWCVDLTFHDPNGTGRVFHVFVNMETKEVARTFYTRAREDRSLGKPLAQRDAFSNGCHEQYGWNVCWEMTAHDGIDFQDATFNGQPIFASAKIGQVEAWYPSWPGGYRDEIGFAASVPPFGGTEINDLSDGFEVRQTFTEFTRWPNCICCYRYEQVVRFYEDGRFEPRFVSHGPGCDDLSVYRPFWRIDLTLNGAGDDEVWLWDTTQWVEAEEEFETFPVVGDLSPDGHMLSTFNGDLHYRWAMERTDPLGLDEAYMFLLARNDMEGEGPIVTGPGDTFIPPRQWIDGEPLSGGDPVLWFVPLLKTKKGGPWWCMPDPEPDFSPCEAILVAEPGEELRQPTEEELAILEAQTPTPLPATPEDGATPAPTATPRPIEGSEPREIILNAGCTACHLIGDMGEAHKVGPDLSEIGYIAGGRVPEMTAEMYIRQSIVNPNAYLAPACPNGPCLPNIMPDNYANRLTPDQLETLVAWLVTLDEAIPQPALIGGDAAATPVGKAAPVSKVAPPVVAPPTMLPVTAVQLILISLVFLISLLLLSRE